MQRDPHLPSPEVCDWLCSLEWSEVVPSAVTTYPEGGRFRFTHKRIRNFSVFAEAAFGTDHIIELELPEEGLAVLRADVEARREYEASDRHFQERATALAQGYLQTQYPRLGGAV